MLRSLRVRALPAAVLLVVLCLSGPADAYRSPILFSVLNDGMGMPTLPNDVAGIWPDGAMVFWSSGLVPGGWPDGTNMMVFPPPALGLIDPNEIDALSWGDDIVIPPTEVWQGVDIEFYFSVDSSAIGAPGLWPPEVFTEVPQAAGDIYFAWPLFFPYGGNHLGVPEWAAGLTPQMPDDLDALAFQMPGDPEIHIPAYFSVDRGSCGVPGSAVAFQCNNPSIPAQAADVFFSFGGGQNFLFADEVTMGLDWNDDNIDAMVLYDWGPAGMPNQQLDPGLDQIYFSVDYFTFGLPGTAVNVEALSGNIQGDVFWSDFQGTNVKVLDGADLGLHESAQPQIFTPDEDNLNALETAWWQDRDGDQIPDIVDNCPDTPNPMQIDTLMNGMGDACDPTGVEVETRLGDAFGLRGIEPNPFRSSTKVVFALPEAGRATIEVFDVAGRRVRTLENREFAAGSHSVTWNGLDEGGRQVGAGIFLVRLVAGDHVSTAKIVHVD